MNLNNPSNGFPYWVFGFKTEKLTEIPSLINKFIKFRSLANENT